MKQNSLLSVVIVTYNNQNIIEKTLSFLLSSLKEIKDSVEIIVVDNGSTDNTLVILKNYKNIKIISSRDNEGYAWANNQGISEANGRYILLLNSDVLVKEKDAIKKMVEYIQNEKNVGVVTCKVTLPNGKIDPACHRGFPTPWAAFTYFTGLEKLFPKYRTFSQYHQWYKPLDTIHEIDSPSGAFYLFSKEIVKTVGLLDEDFFMYGEDLDYSFRIKNKGYKIIFNPQSSVEHLKYQSGLHSVNKETKKRTINAFYEAMIIFYKKHYFRKYPIIISKIIFVMINTIKNLKLAQNSL